MRAAPLRRRWFVRCFSTLLISPVLGYLTFQAAVRWLPASDRLDAVPSSTFIVDRNGTPLAAFVSTDGQWHIPLREDQINPHLFDAIIAVEDSRFRDHHGVDWKSVVAAGWEDLSHLSFRRGASTLTMQLQRLHEPRRRTLWNKLDQAIRAEQLEKRLSKQQILTEYVNAAPFGGNLVGAGAASWQYFGRPCRELSLGECATLAGLPQSPNRLRPDRYPLRAKARRDHVLDRMLACGFISQHERDEAVKEPITATWRPLPQDRAAGLLPADGALPALLGIGRAQPGARVQSTIDAVVQRQVSTATREHLDALASSGISSAAVVVLDTRTSELLASVSLGADTVALDLTRRRRSTGSTLKPFIYAAAFDAGLYGPRSILSDSPAAWPGYEPNDYDRTFRGNLTAAEALAESRNIPAMVVLSKVGIEPAVGLMDAAGIHGLSRDSTRYGLSLAIGGAEASSMEIADGYAMLGRGGLARDASKQLVPLSRCVGGEECGTPAPGCDFNQQVEMHFGLPTEITAGGGCATQSPLPAYRERGKTGRCLRPESCWQVLNAISETTRTTSIFPDAAPSHVAWKTGTSSGHRDAWCAAVTHRKTVVVWLGNPDGQTSPALVGQEAAAPLALKLISLLDPTDEPWPVVPDSSPTLVRASFSNSDLVLIHPADGQQFVLTADSPLQKQRVLLEAKHRDEPSPLWWFMDGRPIGSSVESARLWWDPVAGAHELRVVDSQGHSATARIRVRITQ